MEKQNPPFFLRYSEKSIALSFTAFLLLFYSNFSLIYPRGMFDNEANILFLVSIFLTVAAIFSIFRIFSQKPNSRTQNFFLVCCIVVLNMVIAVGTSLYIFDTNAGKSFLVILPIWHMANAYRLVWMFQRDVIKYDVILESRIKDFIVGIMIITPIFFISQYIFKNYWAITFSLCLSYVDIFRYFVRVSPVIKNLNKNLVT